jgi:hypothetical protein
MDEYGPSLLPACMARMRAASRLHPAEQVSV